MSAYINDWLSQMTGFHETQADWILVTNRQIES